MVKLADARREKVWKTPRTTKPMLMIVHQLSYRQSKQKNMSTKHQRIDWEDINVKAGIAFTLASVASVLIVYLLFK